MWRNPTTLYSVSEGFIKNFCVYSVFFVATKQSSDGWGNGNGWSAETQSDEEWGSCHPWNDTPGSTLEYLTVTTSRPTNFIRVFRDSPIHGSWRIDTSLKIPNR